MFLDIDYLPGKKTNRIQAMVDQMTAMERVANTPIPVSCESILSFI